MQLDFKWIGPPVVVNVEDKQLTTKPRTFYGKCAFLGIEYTVGDQVLISNSEADDPEDIYQCYVAVLVHLYEMKSNKKDPFRALVRWYSRVGQLPTRIRKWETQLDQALDVNWEVVDEGARYKGDISIETIFGKCRVMKRPDGDVPPASEVGRRGRDWVFFCRFALGPKTARCFFPVDSFDSSPEPPQAEPVPTETPVDPAATPKSKRKIRPPGRYIEDAAPLPSPLKNATFNVQNTKELCIVIKRCDSALKLLQASSAEDDDENDFVPTKARKRLVLDTPSKLKEQQERTPKKKTPKKTPAKTPSRRGGVAAAAATPTSKKKLAMTPRSLSVRHESIAEPASPLGRIRRQLHVSAVPQTLPCREDEFNFIYDFVEGKLADGTGGCMYVSGVPGTGKTATVSEVVRLLRLAQSQGDLPDFKLVEVNGMKLTTPQQIYVQVWHQLTGNKVTADNGLKLLHAKFSAQGPRHLPTVLIVDELDLLWTRQQDVLYNIFEWPNRPKAQLTVLAIANTMDLPERMLINKVASRMGLTRLIFQPYKVKQLQTIISSRLENAVMFEPEAVEFIARKVSAASGDARRALDIARRAAELADAAPPPTAKSPAKKSTARKAAAGENGHSDAKSTVTMRHVQRAIEEMFSSPKLLAVQACSLHEQIFLNALVQEYNRTGVEESLFHQVVRQHYTLCDLEGIGRPSVSELLAVCASLSSSRLILSEHGRNDICQKLHLNIGMDDVTYALKAD